MQMVEVVKAIISDAGMVDATKPFLANIDTRTPHDVTVIAQLWEELGENASTFRAEFNAFKEGSASMVSGLEGTIRHLSHEIAPRESVEEAVAAEEVADSGIDAAVISRLELGLLQARQQLGAVGQAHHITHATLNHVEDKLLQVKGSLQLVREEEEVTGTSWIRGASRCRA
jgi:hypothetical protein